MGTFAKGDVVLYPFPYTNLKGQKLRPCLVLSNEMNDDILLCQITSQKVKADKFSIELKKDETIDGSLLIDSFIRCNMLFTCDKSDIKKIICRIDEEKYIKISLMINRIISIHKSK